MIEENEKQIIKENKALEKEKEEFKDFEKILKKTELKYLIYLMKQGKKQEYKYLLKRLNTFGSVKKNDLIKLIVKQYSNYNLFNTILNNIKKEEKQLLINIRLYNKRFLMDYKGETLETLFLK